jgi:hypothetical protein
MGREYSMYRRDEKCIKYFDQKTVRKRPLRRRGYRWDDSIRMCSFSRRTVLNRVSCYFCFRPC